MVDSAELAKYILAKVPDVKHLKLQKLLYYIEAWHLAIEDDSIIDDQFQAWVHGPVSEKIWHIYKAQSTLYNIIAVDRAALDTAVRKLDSTLTEEQKELISDVLEEYGSKTAYALECLTHAEEPWRAARKGVPDGEASSNIISKDAMKRFYRQRLDAVG
jgi:uncharacterized phage-associated protein